MSMKWWTAYSSITDRSARKRGSGKRASLLAALSLSLALSGCSLLPSEPEEEDLSGIQLPRISERPSYDVETKTLETVASGSGRIMSTEEKELYFTLEGKRIQKLYIQSGQQVEAGQVVAELDVDDIKKQLRRESLSFKQQELSMKETLRKKDEMDPIEFEMKSLQFEEARQALVDLQEDIDKAVLTSPFSGTVVSVAVQEGDQVKAYDTIAVVANPSSLIVAAELNSRDDLQRVAIGMEVRVDINNAGRITGKIKQLPIPSTDNQNGGNSGDSLNNYLLIDVDELPESVTRGTPLSIQVIVNRKENATVIPLAALRTVGARTYVQVVEPDGSKREVDVEVGQQTSTDAEILNGLTPGQKVVGR
ncbi:efflux RND transporter periplasmic adaptor subunit [Paenibacillaceae bacterium WGS1546]|uniref:efflux RND transporter periplasmic adaptor subunit n=1 Tax=Cohnella sp. WGS1546 TaxID=3366810 RepID=UPI00372D3C07